LRWEKPGQEWRCMPRWKGKDIPSPPKYPSVPNRWARASKETVSSFETNCKPAVFSLLSNEGVRKRKTSRTPDGPWQRFQEPDNVSQPHIREELCVAETVLGSLAFCELEVKTGN
jgi:hypothetical protein